MSKSYRVLCALILAATMAAGCGPPALEEEPLAEDAFFVSIQGDDKSDGSEGAPWQTIQHAVDQLSPGQTAYVHEGIYSERIEINVSGDEAAGPVTLAAAPDEHLRLDHDRRPQLPGDGRRFLR